MTRHANEEVSDAMLMALADGELGAAEATALRRRMMGDADLAERFAVFAETAALLQSAYGNDPVPDRLVQAVLMAPAGDAPEVPVMPANVVPLRRPAPRMVWPVALAASLLLAVGAGFWAGQGAAPGVAAGPQAAALALASVPTGGTAALADGRTARALGSFATDLGACRMIGIEGAGPAERVVACQAGDGWQVALAIASGGEGAFLPASDLATGVVDGFLDEIGAGPALTPEEEAALLR